ncbi:hypothetical protein Avbf_16062, partial [Armadillidium vulgare]
CISVQSILVTTSQFYERNLSYVSTVKTKSSNSLIIVTSEGKIEIGLVQRIITRRTKLGKPARREGFNRTISVQSILATTSQFYERNNLSCVSTVKTKSTLSLYKWKLRSNIGLVQRQIAQRTETWKTRETGSGLGFETWFPVLVEFWIASLDS